MNHLKDCIKNLSILILFTIILIGMTTQWVNFLWAEDWAKLRENMVSKQMKARDITDPEVLKVMGEVPRHLFVPKYAQR